jgi:hypothetical protein
MRKEAPRYTASKVTSIMSSLRPSDANDLRKAAEKHDAAHQFDHAAQ